jgi:hypothetical protein
MADSLPSPSLSRAREQKIEELSHHFANDDLSLDDLERRIERVYKAVSVADLDGITSDLRPSGLLAGPPPARSQPSLADPAMVSRGGGAYEVPHSRLVAFMSSTRRMGRWAVPRDLDMFAMMSDNRLDLTSAALPAGGVVTLDVTAIMASIKIIVAPGMRVVNEMHSFMADVASGADELPSGLTSPDSPVIRLVGTAIMSEIKVTVGRPEDRGNTD